MNTSAIEKRRRPWAGWRVLNLIAGLALLAAAVGGATPALPAIARAQPLLLQLAAQNPDQLVRIIVQQITRDGRAKAHVAVLGGQITQDLAIINAFTAEMRAAAAVQLARHDDVRWVSVDTAMELDVCSDCIDVSKLANVYVRAVRAPQVWNQSPYRQGQGIGIAVVDSGINPNADLYTTMGVNRQVADVHFNTDSNSNTSDGYGHGTVVSSILGGDGSDSGGKYIGVAPMANVINVKVTNDDGSATASSVVAGLQWVLENKETYNIRVVNLSFNSSVAESYETSPLDAAVEVLWFNNIVVVASAGNKGSGAIYPPANDPFVITVGATDDKGSATLADDVIATFSAYGTTADGFQKPDLVAPGKNVIGRIVNANMGMGKAHPSNVISGGYFKMSGTSVSAPIVSGAVALLLQDEPNLTPDQVKFRLKSTANKTWAGYNATKAGAGYLDVFAAVNGTTTGSANTGQYASELLSTGSEPITWSSVGWNSVGWNSVGWNSVGWNSVGWNSVGWNSDYWGQ